jgi:hypothetical protein
MAVRQKPLGDRSEDRSEDHGSSPQRVTAPIASDIAAVMAVQKGAGNRAVARLLSTGGAGGRRLDRRLKASVDSEAVWRAFLALARPAAELDFVRNKATGVVSTLPWTPPKAQPPAGPTRLAPGAAPSLNPPKPSATFKRRMQSIIADATQDAEIHFGKGQKMIFVGGFPKGGKPDKKQRIDIDDIELIERWTPGHGVALLLHEIEENYAGHAAQGKPGSGFDFESAHALAKQDEASVVKELAGGYSTEGGSSEMQAPGSADKLVAFDYVNHFLVVTVAPDSSVISSRKTGAKLVTAVTLGPFQVGSDFVDHTTTANLKALATVMTAWVSTDLATLRFLGRTDASDKAAGAPAGLELSRARTALKRLNLVFKGATPFRTDEVALLPSSNAGREVRIEVVVPAI